MKKNWYIGLHQKILKTNRECTSPDVNFCVNYGVWANIMWQCSFINFSKSAPLVGDADRGWGGGWACVRSGHIINFSVNIKLLSPKDFNSNNKFNFILKHFLKETPPYTQSKLMKKTYLYQNISLRNWTEKPQTGRNFCNAYI